MPDQTKYRITVSPSDEPTKGEYFFTCAVVVSQPAVPGQPVSDTGSIEKPRVFAYGYAVTAQSADEQAEEHVRRWHNEPVTRRYIELDGEPEGLKSNG